MAIFKMPTKIKVLKVESKASSPEIEGPSEIITARPKAKEHKPAPEKPKNPKAK
jgi:hypothetical protein